VVCVLWGSLCLGGVGAVAVAAATTAVTLAYGAPEAYSAVLTLLLGPTLVLAWGALHRPAAADGDDSDPTAGGWGAVLGTGLFLGLGATFYSLYFGVAVFAVCLMAVIAAALAVRAQHTWRAVWPILVRLIGMGVLAGVLALAVWTPFLLKFLSGKASLGSGSAFHYLPETGSRLPLPMTDFDLLGVFCLVGTIWLVLRAGSSRRAQALGIGVVAIYLWCLLSMAATAAGTTLLSFRLESPLLALLAAAGVFGFAEGARAVYQALNEPSRFRIAAAAVALAGAIGFSQGIPTVLATEITTAYTDTDGNGDRADQRAPSAVSYYREIDAKLLEQTGRPRDGSVVLTADTSFLAIYPYYGFQALTSHYANPLADFAARTAEIQRWSTLKTPQELTDALEHCRWRAPDAFLFRRSGDDYTLRLSQDVYPNDPNVKRITVTFPKALFDAGHYRITDIGPFTLMVRV
ncbi:arabinofuranosyltransferase, partial [Nocardia tengchongensis]|uniref:arabinofuranosyltransferase n=1 Tax=Nocardia tengchongensis TaxID=2055889 RepID=UPI0036A9879F